MRIVIAIVLALIAFLTGVYYAEKLKNRMNFLQKMLLITQDIATIFEYQAETLPNVIRILMERDTAMLSQVFEAASKGESITPVVSRQLDGVNYLTEADKGIVRNLALYLGSTDLNGQLSQLSLTKTMLQTALTEATEAFNVKAKMYRRVSTLCGIGIAIIIM